MNAASLTSVSGVSTRRAVMSSTIQIPRPCGPIKKGAHVAKGVQVKCDVSRAFIEMPRFQRGHPWVAGKSLDVAHDVGPRLAAVSRNLHVTVVSTDPDYVWIPGRFGNGIDGC